MDELAPIKSDLRKHKERKYLEDKIKNDPKTLTIKPEVSATDTDQITAAFGAFVATQGEIEVPWHVKDGQIVLHKEEIATKAEVWNKRADEFISKHGFSSEMSSNLENTRQLENDYAEMSRTGDFSKAAEAERRFVNNLQEIAGVEKFVYRSLDELRNDLHEIAIEDAPTIHTLCHDICCCRVNCCERPDVMEQSGQFYCNNCDDLCEEPIAQ